MKVLKFGGTSLADRQRFEEAANLVHEAARDGRVVVVASAVAGTTNRLSALIESSNRIDVDWKDEVCAVERQHLEVLATLPLQCRNPAAR